jgi:hypothetical protein
LKTKFCPPNELPKTTCFTDASKSSTCFSHDASTCSTKVLGLGFGLSIIGVSQPFGILKTSYACVIKSIKVTFAPTLIYGMAYGIGLKITNDYNSST